MHYSIILFLLFQIQSFAQEQNRTDPHFWAKKVIEQMGGAKNFDQTNYISWNFFGYRNLIWDKQNQVVRIDFIKKPLTIITSLQTNETILFIDGVEITAIDSLTKYSEEGKKIWMNDSYWLVMPFKILDEGVHLSYLKKVATKNSEHIVLEMTFNNVGATPLNKYWLYIDTATQLITQWDYFNHYEDGKPEFSNAWLHYQTFGKILLSTNRGNNGNLTQVNVWENLPTNIFTQLKLPSTFRW